jgi:hypothetical protein
MPGTVFRYNVSAVIQFNRGDKTDIGSTNLLTLWSVLSNVSKDELAGK